MATGRDDSITVPSFAEVLRAPVFLPVFIVATLSTWGDYIARITVAAVVFSWTGSALATAATFAVSLVPSILGRALLSPLCDRVAPRVCLVATHLVRAVLVGVLILVVATTHSLWLVLTLVAVLEFAGGPAVTAGQMLLTDIFPDRRLYARAFGLTTLAAQVNQAVGLAIGGVVVGLIGDTKTLFLDLATFVVGAVILIVVKPPKSLVKPDDSPTANLLGELAQGWRQIRSNRVLTYMLWLSLASALAIAAPEAVALPYAAQHSPSQSWGGLLMAAPILGSVVGLLFIGRLPAERQSALVMRLALLTPLPLLVTIFEPPLAVVWTAWFLSGALQSYMLPLQAAFTLLVPTAMRGRVFGLAGALSVGVTGACFLAAGWVSEHTTPAASVGICAVVTLGVLVLLAARWPKEELAGRVEATFTGEQAGTDRDHGVGRPTEHDGLGDLAGLDAVEEHTPLGVPDTGRSGGIGDSGRLSGG
ncbi:MFS transporter [Pedococcus bigeumensis]|uniref:MFS transporter n=1 Tax=Pedococcus bigeumensis TaxID=433644 RepID=A0A502D391_9MICO|nr:MFS transporter [Pedococcus bigeumensis]TPG19668.1 MFS transporter [Pedococcus bigeumensis]